MKIEYIFFFLKSSFGTYLSLNWHFDQNQSPGEPYLDKVLQGRSKSKFKNRISYIKIPGSNVPKYPNLKLSNEVLVM